MSPPATKVTLHPPDAPFAGSVAVPGDKSLSHRALILGALAAGESHIANQGPGEDIASTRSVLRALGVTIDGGRLASPGRRAWREPVGPLDCGNSGTTLRLMAGALATRPYRSELTGDVTLLRRPMGRLVGPLEALGASIEVSDGERAPITVHAPGELRGTDVEIPIASAQARTAFELAALEARGSSVVSSPPGFRDHTERWLEALGRGRWLDRNRFQVVPGELEPFEYVVPGDPSSAAFLWAAAAVKPGARVTTPGITLNPGRIGFLQVLESMGAGIEAEVTGSAMGDPIGSVTVYGGVLAATEVSGELAAATLDELPLVGVLGAYAEGMTVVRDAAELRGKESDRIATTVAMIRALGGGAEATEDGFVIVGTGWLETGTVESHGDHRIAMAGAVAATAATGAVRIDGAGAAAVSWPGFYEVLEGLWSSR
ncbi:MAG TPA: 3-phosphoshikimate 1-carboxyvinyltransferase [Acidimicrobiia bacterium]